MMCSSCLRPILIGSPIMGHFQNGNNRNLEHIHHRACFVAKTARRCICPISEAPLDLNTLPSLKKEEI